MELRPGIVTPGIAQEHFVLSMLGIPEDLSGMTVLDIGCWDGFFSFECERRGAARVVSSDVWDLAGRRGFDLAREELGSKAEPVECSVYDLPEKLDGERFDLVLFLGVLYHMKHPLLALERVAETVKPGGLAIVDTAVDYQPMSEPPRMRFYPGDELNGDFTNWWTPNLSCVIDMLGVSGFAKIISYVQLHGGDRSVFHATKATDEDCAARIQHDYEAGRKFQ